MTFEPLEIVGVITDEVGKPRNDGTAGSGLYRVPVRLSRSVTHDEAQYLVHLWDRPPSFTTMHRPGTANVSGDRFVLGSTTIEEVRDTHARTLRLVVDRFNDTVPEMLAKQAAAEQRIADAEAAHRKQVDEVADDITF